MYPSLAEMCGLPAPANIEGRSFAGLLTDPTQSARAAALTQHPRPFYSNQPPTTMGYSIRTDDFRYTEWRAIAGGAVVARELYFHRADPLETRNVIDDASFAADIARLQPLLAETIKQNVTPTKTPSP